MATFKKSIIAFGIEMEEGYRCPVCDRKLKRGTQVLDENGNLTYIGEDCAVKMFGKDHIKSEKVRIKVDKEYEDNPWF